MKATFVRKQPENSGLNIITFWFKPDSALDQIAGQYILLTLPHKNADERGESRWFTLSSSPTDAPLFSITTKLSKKHSSFKNTLNSLKPGDSAAVSEPMGDFVLPKDSSIPLVFIAYGLGLTPYHAIIKYLIDTKEQRDITLLYSVHSNNETIFPELGNLAVVKKIVMLKTKIGSPPADNQRLDAKKIINLTKPTDNSLIYLAGPEPAVEKLVNQLIEIGIEKHRLVIDLFTGYN